MIAVMMAAMIVSSNICGVDMIHAAGNYTSTVAQSYYKTELIEHVAKGNAVWSYRLNSPESSSGYPHITDLQLISYTSGNNDGEQDILSIPAEFDGIPVTEIGTGAFKGNTAIQGIVVPACITRICDQAFEGCTGLKSVVFEDDSRIEVLGEKAFYRCSSLEKITLGKNLMKSNTTGNYAFSGCTALKKVTIKNVDALSVPEGSFDGCRLLSDVNILLNGVLQKGARFGKYSFRGTSVGDMDFTYAVTVEEGAFKACAKVCNVTFRKGATLGKEAYANSITSSTGIVAFDGGIANIGEKAFCGCTKLSDMKFSDSMEGVWLEKQCLKSTGSLKALELQGKNASVGQSAFSGCSLVTLEFNNKVTTEINGDIFGEMNQSLSSVAFDSKNVVWKEKTFQNATGMKSLIFKYNVMSVTGILDGAIKLDNIQYYSPATFSGTVITDTTGTSYTNYGYWKNENGELDEAYKNDTLHGYEEIQTGLVATYKLSNKIDIGANISTTAMWVGNVLYDGSIVMGIPFSSDGTSKTGFTYDLNAFEQPGEQYVTVTYGGYSEKVLFNVVDSKGIYVPTPTVTNTPEATVIPSVLPTVTMPPIVTATITPTAAPSRPLVEVTYVPSEIPTDKPTDIPVLSEAPTDKPTVTQVPTVTCTAAPTKSLGNRISPKPTSTPKLTTKVTPVVTKKATSTPKPTYVNLSMKSNVKRISLKKISSKVDYKLYTNKTVELRPVAGKQKIQYQLVKAGSKVSSKKWKKAGKKVSISKEGRYVVYFRTLKGNKYQVRRTSGFTIDKTAPEITVSSSDYKLSVKDSGSGVKAIYLNGVRVSNGVKLCKGKSIVKAVDKAGNVRRVSVSIY